MPDAKILYCTFCDKPNTDVTHLIMGPGLTGICNECVALCVAIIDRERPRPPINEDR